MNTILVIEDDNLIQEVMSDILPMEGYKCRLANNGLEALDSIANCPPDLILLDLNMPVMDGQTFLQRYSEHGNQQVPIVLLSRFNNSLKDFTNYIADYLPKPFGAVELLTCVRSNLESAQIGSQTVYH